MIAVLASVLTGLGVFYLYSAFVLRWPGVGFGPTRPAGDVTVTRSRQPAAQQWLAQAGLADVPMSEFSTVIGALAVFGAVAGFLVFGGVLPTLMLAGFFGALPVAMYKRRRAAAREKAQEGWPRMIEEIRLLTGSVGRSIPQALFEVGRSAPEELRPAFDAAHREWLLSTDFHRTIDLLKAQLADPTADATCETLLIAHELGGADLDARLANLAEDRRTDTHDRKDARAKLSGARFARIFVLLVPMGMAVMGLSVGNGRDAYTSPIGQIGVLIALSLMIVCWWWASAIMRLPDEDRVFNQ